MNIEETIKNIKERLEKNDEIFEETGSYLYFSKEVKKEVQDLLTAYEKEKEKNKSLEQENSFLKMMYRGTDEFKVIENLAKEE